MQVSEFKKSISKFKILDLVGDLHWSCIFWGGCRRFCMNFKGASSIPVKDIYMLIIKKNIYEHIYAENVHRISQ